MRETLLDLTLSDIRDLTEAVTGDLGRTDRPFGTYVFGPADAGAALARHVEREVFEESFGSTDEELAQEFADYDAASLHLCVVDHRRQLPVGSTRLIVPNAVGLKSLDDLELIWGQPAEEVLTRNHLDFDVRECWDIATLAVAPGYRNRFVSQALHQAICATSVPAGIRWCVTVLDTRVLRLLQLQLNRAFRTFEGVDPMMYYGSVSVPCWIDLVGFQRRLAADDPELGETLFEGRHLDAYLSTPDWAEAGRMARAVSRAVSGVDEQARAHAA